MEKKELLTKEQLIELYKLLENKILKNKEKFKEKRFKDDELIQILLKTILLQEQLFHKGIINYINLEKIDFTDQDIIFIDLTKTNINTNLDPQKLKNKSIQGVKLKGDYKDKSFDGVCVKGVDFRNAENVVINPQKIAHNDLSDTICDKVDFNNNSFDGVNCENADLSKAKNCTLNETKYHKLKAKILKI